MSYKRKVKYVKSEKLSMRAVYNFVTASNLSFSFSLVSVIRKSVQLEGIFHDFIVFKNTDNQLSFLQHIT